MSRMIDEEQVEQGRGARRKARTRAELLTAARQVFAERGFHNASIAEITKAADVGVGTFYLHFRDKEDIFHSMLEEGVEHIREQVAKAVANTPQRDKLETGLRVGFHLAYKHRDLFRVTLNEGMLFPASLRVEMPLVNLISDGLQQAAAQGLLEGYDPALLARFMSGVVLQAIAWWFDHDEPGPDGMAEQVLRFMRHGLPHERL